MKKNIRTAALLSGVAGLLALGGVYMVWHKGPVTPAPTLPVEKLAAGLALPETSSTQITVLKAPTEVENGTPVTQSNELLPSTAKVDLVEGKKPAANVPAPVFDANAARLGTTLSLLLSTWGQGGVLPHQLANTAAQLAEKTGNNALASAAADLRRSTPREGPATLALLLVEMDKALMMDPPENLPETDADAMAQKSWFRRQLELFVTLSHPASQDSWNTALLTAQQLIARGAIADAANTLEASPLGQDNRLTPLRQQVRTYILQRGRLNHTITTYANTFLTIEGAE